jgi:hypothetical protein
MDTAQIYDSPEALKKFEPHYRKVRYGLATKIEKASRQQRMWWQSGSLHQASTLTHINRQAAQEPFKGVARHSEGQGREEEEGRLNDGMTREYGAASVDDGTIGCHVAYLHPPFLQTILHTLGEAMALGSGPILAW